MASISQPKTTHGATGSHLAITPDELFHLRLVASGKELPSLIIRNGLVLAVHTGEILERDVIIKGRHIAALTPWGWFKAIDGDVTKVVDAAGHFVAPGMIDTHIHVEYTKLRPGELARLSVPRGTTMILADPNCITNVLGVPGMDFMNSTNTPLRILRQVSHKVPGLSPELELGGKHIETDELSHLVQLSTAATLGESNPFSLDNASAIKQSAALTAGKRITGHTALLSNEPLWQYVAGGIGDDHNASLPSDVKDRIRLGMMLTVMSGSMNSNIASVFSDLELLDQRCLDHMSFCADDKLVEDIDATGHIDRHVREAIQLGVNVVDAWRMATWNPARYYRIDHLVGSVTPGRLADILVLPNLEDARPNLVIASGAIAARDNIALFDNDDPIPSFTLDTVHIHKSMLDADTFAVKAIRPQERSTAMPDSAWVQAMEMYDGYWKRAFHAKLSIDATGYAVADTTRDILKVVVIDRHHATPNRGIGYVRGFGLKEGAIACTTNCENQNLVIVGVTDSVIAAMVRAYTSLPSLSGGGFAVMDGSGSLLSSVPLPVGGCMSDRPWEIVRDQSIACDEAARSIGCTMNKPFMIASFIGLGGVPDLGLTEKGLIDVQSQTLIDVVLDVDQHDEEIALDNARKLETPKMVCCRCPAHRHDVHRLMDPLSFEGFS